MANIVFKVGTLDLSSFVRVTEKTLNLGQGDMIEPAFSDSPFFEGQYLTSTHAKNKELQVPLFLHPPNAPYTQDALNQLIQQVNQALRPIVDLGQVVNAEWKNAQASNSTFFTIQYGRFDPDFTFRITEKGWLAGVLHLWVLPYGHTATQRSLGTYAAPANQSGLVVQPASMLNAGGTVVGDVPPQFEILTTVGSYLGEDGRLGIIAALPQASYTPIIPVGSFLGLSASAAIYGASGAWASQYLALDSQGSQTSPGGASNLGNQYFSFALSPGSIYAGNNRVMGLVRARRAPFALRALDSTGAPLGPTVIASAMDGWQLVDYGIIRVPPWQGTSIVSIQSFPNIEYSSSGMFAPVRAAPAWTKEHGSIFVIPQDSAILDLDWNSPGLAMDGFDGASGAAIGQDQLGNQWTVGAGWATPVYTGNSQICCGSGAAIAFSGASSILQNTIGMEMEMLFTVSGTASGLVYQLIQWNVPRGDIGIDLIVTPNSFSSSFGGSQAISLLPGQYHMKFFLGPSISFGNLAGPSGAFTGAASGVVASVAGAGFHNATSVVPAFAMKNTNGGTAVGTSILEAFRARVIASNAYQSRDILHLHQPNAINVRANPSAVDVTDLQSRQRGAIQSVNLPVPSLGSGLFVASFPWDQGPANDLLNVDVRVRERFTYAR